MFDKKEYMKEYNKKYRIEHPEYIKEYYHSHSKYRDKVLINSKVHREEHDKKYKEYMKEWRKNNKDKIIESQKIYRIKNRIKLNNYDKKYIAERYRTDLKFNLNARIRSLINRSLKGNKNGYHWEDIVGYTLDELKNHFKEIMPKGYCWQDFMEGKLHIDHIIPVSIFNFSKPEHINFKKCWSLNNLQLLPAIENLSKSNKINKPFQLALAI